MFCSTRRLGIGYLAGLSLFLLASGCGQNSSEPPRAAAPVAVVESEPPVPGEMELSDPKATFRDEEVVLFQVKYRFTKGKPDKFYQCTILFPGTTSAGIKDMERSELQAEGVIKDGVRTYKNPVKAYEISVAEGPSQLGPWRKMSNVVSGTIGQ